MNAPFLSLSRLLLESAGEAQGSRRASVMALAYSCSKEHP